MSQEGVWVIQIRRDLLPDIFAELRSCGKIAQQPERAGSEFYSARQNKKKGAKVDRLSAPPLLFTASTG